MIGGGRGGGRNRYQRNYQIVYTKIVQYRTGPNDPCTKMKGEGFRKSFSRKLIPNINFDLNITKVRLIRMFIRLTTFISLEGHNFLVISKLLISSDIIRFCINIFIYLPKVIKFSAFTHASSRLSVRRRQFYKHCEQRPLADFKQTINRIGVRFLFNYASTHFCKNINTLTEK